MPRQIGVPIQQAFSMGWNRLKVSVDFTQVAWNTVADHRVFTVAGVVRAVLFYHVTGSLTSGGAATIQFGATGATTVYAASQAYTNLVANRLVAPNSTVTAYTAFSFFVMNNVAKPGDFIAVGGASNNLGYNVGTAALTGGTIDAYCYWTPISDDGVVTAGTGGAL